MSIIRYIEESRDIVITELKQSYGDITFKKGIYGIVDININRIMYVGTTGIAFASRWLSHMINYTQKTHKNEYLCKLFDSGKFCFLILQVIDETLSREEYDLIEREWIYRLGTHVKFGGCNKSAKKPDGTSYVIN